MGFRKSKDFDLWSNDYGHLRYPKIGSFASTFPEQEYIEFQEVTILLAND